MTHLNYRSMHIWPPTRLDDITWSFTFDTIFFLIHNIRSFWDNYISLWQCLLIFLLNRYPLAFWTIIHFIYFFWSLSLFPSWILVCATGFCSSISLFIWRFTFGELFLVKTKRIKSGKICRHKSMHVSRSTKTIH